MKIFLCQFVRRLAAKPANLRYAAFLVLLGTLHHFSIGWMAESRIIEYIMTGGSDAGIGTIAAVLGFILLRMIIVFLLPGFILSRLGLELIDFLFASRPPPKREGLPQG